MQCYYLWFKTWESPKTERSCWKKIEIDVAKEKRELERLEETCGLRKGRETERKRPSLCVVDLFSLKLATSHADE